MPVKLLLLLITILPAVSFAQMSFADSTDKKIMREDCNDRVFTKTEIPPSLKKDIKSFEDTLTVFLKRTGLFSEGSNGTYQFILTKNADITGFKRISGNLQNEQPIGEFIRLCSFMWKPAIQNSYKVCSYVQLEIEIPYNGSLKAAVQQSFRGY